MFDRCVSRAFIAVFLLTGQCLAQTNTFAAASIRVNNSGGTNGSIGMQGRRFVAANMTLRALLLFAYRSPSDPLLDEQILQLPDWANVERFDIQATPEGETPSQPLAAVREMVRSLLEDRFQLKVHRETRDLPVYDLVLADKGPTVSKDQTPPPANDARIRFVSDAGQLESGPRGELRMTSGQSTSIIGTAISIPRLLQVLQGQSDRIIINKTGFEKLIDVHIEFSQNLAAPQSGDPGTAESQSAGAKESSPSLFTALQEIGLKLKPGKAPLEAIVVDTVRPPSAN